MALAIFVYKKHTYLPIFLVLDQIPKIDKLPLLDFSFEVADVLASLPNLLRVFRQFIANVGYPCISAAGVTITQPVFTRMKLPVRFILDLRQ